MATNKKRKKKKNSTDVYYHILFWIIVIAIWPVSISVWFWRTKRFNIDQDKKRIILAGVWALAAVLIILAAVIPKISAKISASKESKSIAESESISASESESVSISESESVEEDMKSVLEITWFNMGQSDAALICCDDHYMLIDSGDLSVELSARLLALNIDTVDYIAASTTLDESVGGFARAMSYFTVRNAYCAETDGDSDKFKNFTDALDDQNVTLQVPENGTTVSLGAAEVTFYVTGETYEGVNSLVIMIEHKGYKYLFCGEAGKDELEALSASGVDLDCDVVKVGNHGADYTLSDTLLQAMTPQYAVISLGEGYGCPSEQTKYLLQQAGVTTYRTDLNGDISLTGNVSGITFTTENEAASDPVENTYDPANPPAEPTRATEETETEAETETVPSEETAASETEAPAEETTAVTAEAASNLTMPADAATNGAVPTEATPNAQGFTYCRLKNENIFHLTTCPLVQGLSSAEVEFYTVTRDEIVNHWAVFTPCTVCNP